MKENYAIYKVWDGCKAPSNLEFNGRLRGQLVRTVSVDVDALLELADEINEQARSKESSCFSPNAAVIGTDYASEIASRIREALGAVDG